jgi:hypothetical protein
MKAKHKILVTGFIITCMFNARCQVISFDTLGKITALTIGPKPIDATLINAALAQTAGKDHQAIVADHVLNESFINTVNFLKGVQMQKFWKRYLGTSNYDSYITYYGRVQGTFKTKLEAAKTDALFYYEKDTVFRRNLFNRAMMTAFTDEYTSHYKTQLFLPQSLDSLRILAGFINTTSNVLESYKKQINEKTDDDAFDELYGKLYLFLKEIDVPVTEEPTNHFVKKTKDILNSQWIKEWLWVRNGEISLNPLDFTSKDFIAQHPEYDETRSKLYNDFVERSIDNMLSSTDAQDLEKFKNLLKEKGRGKELYSYKERYDSLLAKNTSFLKAATEGTTALNQLSPDSIGNGGTHVITEHNEFKIANNNASLESALKIGKDPAKKIAVINVPNIGKIKLDAKTASIADRSRFQTSLDSVVGQLGILAGFIGGLTPAAPFLAIIRPKETSAINKVQEISKKDIPKKEDQLKSYFNLIDSKEKVDKKTAEKRIASIKKELQIQLAEAISEYEILQKAFCNTTLPPSTIKPLKNTSAKYRTVTLYAQNTSKPSEVKARILSITGTDTTVIKQFEYRTGKVYRVQMSAGAVYNLFVNEPRYQQTKIEKVDGQIKISNSQQPFNLFVGVNFYCLGKGLFIQDDRAFRHQGRWSLIAAIGISKMPTDNFFLGLSYDIVPGLRANLLTQFFRNDKFFIENDEIVYQRVAYKWAPVSVGLSIDPVTLTKGISNLLKLNSK